MALKQRIKALIDVSVNTGIESVVLKKGEEKELEFAKPINLQNLIDMKVIEVVKKKKSDSANVEVKEKEEEKKSKRGKK